MNIRCLLFHWRTITMERKLTIGVTEVKSVLWERAEQCRTCRRVVREWIA